VEKVDLTNKIGKAEYHKVMQELTIKMGELQRQARQMDIPITLVFEGWGASGKGMLLNKLIQALDPRGLTVYPMNNATEEDKLHPYLWRYWVRIPQRGRVAIFDQSWYQRVLAERVENLIKEKKWRKAYYEINSFERQLADDGHVIVKFFLHISKAEQKKRFREIEKDPEISWRVTDVDWLQHKQYSKHLAAVEEMIEKTNTDYAPWYLVETYDKRSAIAEVYTKVIHAIENKIREIHEKSEQNKLYQPVNKKTQSSGSAILDKIDLTKTIDKLIYKPELAKLQGEIRELTYTLYRRKIPLIIVYEGWDAAGKGSNIKRLTQTMDPRGYKVIPISAPNEVEREYHYLWRFWREIPQAGNVVVFDRSWYGRVLVERVENFCSTEEWTRAYEEINEMEEQLVESGAVVLKFWLHIDQEEQLKRFEERKNNPHKQWKITDEDWRNREQWEPYQHAIEEMLLRTSTTYAPWTIVEANSKYYARIKVLKTLIKSVETRLASK